MIVLCAFVYALPEMWLREVDNGSNQCVLSQFGLDTGEAIAILNAVVLTITYIMLITANSKSGNFFGPYFIHSYIYTFMHLYT